jgi:hypothetical protein
MQQYIKYPFIIIGILLVLFFFVFRKVGKIATKQLEEEKL